MGEQENNVLSQVFKFSFNLQRTCIGNSVYVNDTHKYEHFKLSANNNKLIYHHVTQLTNQGFGDVFQFLHEYPNICTNRFIQYYQSLKMS